ncbi:hypothetical protein EW026_g4898 [Hermanssonia centrifuga]|uniref:Phospholipase n=1 Tax=Hermanssonia centrifuga TaxID=98765 RepID=A0A4S4KFS4_9APHY|nr:hypothetical protein EW026_g4898 [Hermanssonia centrifuga]
MASIARPPHGIPETVKALFKEQKSTPTDEGEGEHPQDPPITKPSQLQNASTPSSSQKPNSPRVSMSQGHSHKRSAGTPSARTGPPRSISHNYSISGSHNASRANSHDEHEDVPSIREPDGGSSGEYQDPNYIRDFVPATSPFRSALEYPDSERPDRKGKRRESYFHDVFNPSRWIAESPREEHTMFEEPEQEEPQSPRAPSIPHPRRPTLQSPTLSTSSSRRFGAARRAKSLPHIESGGGSRSNAAPRWNRLRSLIPHIAAQSKDQTAIPSSAVAPQSVNITDELIAGGLSTVMLRLWFERDEKDHRRVPVLFHRLRVRVSDSLHPLHGHKAVFRIECEYANGAAKWVVYRQLREFISLHTHYTISNAYNRNADELPEFPRAGLPYFNFLKERTGEFSRTEFARMQRESLENYLVGLIRAVMFHPTANRLASFLEVSALSIALAQSGGAQYKAGFLQIEAVGNKGTFGKRATGWKDKKKQKWCAVRESYLVVVEEMGELTVHDVFLVDSDFKIERPTRYYRQGLNLLKHPEIALEEDDAEDKDKHDAKSHASKKDSIRSRLSKVFHLGHHPKDATGNEKQANGGIEHRATSPSPSSSSSGAELTRQITPMLDPSTNTNPLLDPHDKNAGTDKSRRGDVSKHTFYISNSQMRLKLFAKNERQMLQWIAALEKVARESHYIGKNRFDSFAPIRLNVAAQWLVDGRDYFWNLSRAILLAKECIYIHDWWLSPELHMRRPGMEKYRLDRLLERKAKEGVKIYVILYQEVSSRTTPTDSNYAKQRLSALHPNIMVQRSPSHFQTGTFYWAHHEKMCVIDQAIAFMGGLDLCFGRWDTPQHVLVDDPENSDGGDVIWPGKDYSNPRIVDFHQLSKPDEDMHDVSMQMVGQPARDLARHFVQRWNYLLRIKNHTRPMPSLLPPPEFRPGELSALGLTGTCELQICRSAGPWSMGTPDRIECSIQNAYLKAIQLSEHFVYIENQFFITSTVVNEVKIENKIGDAIVHRIIRAHNEGTPFKVCIVIPLLPGFTFPVDHSDASAVCIVDDRLAIIGSANINERSQRGDRDSEVAAVIRDTDMMDCTMAGKPFKVGRFAHTLRIRLMREHLGVDVDAMYEEDLMANEPVQALYEQKEWDPETEQVHGAEDGVTHVGKSGHHTAFKSLVHDTIDGIEQAIHGTGDVEAKDTAMLLRKTGLKTKGLDSNAADKSLVKERQSFTRGGEKEPGFTSSVVPTMEEKLIAEYSQASHNGDAAPREDDDAQNGSANDDESSEAKADGQLYGVPANGDTQHDEKVPSSDADEQEERAPEARSTIRKHLSAKFGSKTWTLPTPTPHVDPHGFEDPISDEFWKNVWLACAVHNTEIYRKVFHAVPDDLITTWKQYKEFIVHHERLNKPVKGQSNPEPLARLPSESGDMGVPGQQQPSTEATAENAVEESVIKGKDYVEGNGDPNTTTSGSGTANNEKDTRKRKASGATEPFDQTEREDMEKLLEELRGHLVLYPNRFLEGEDVANNFLFNADRLLPLPIYD